MTYYDIDEILAEDELVPCTPLIKCAYLGHLHPESSSSELKENTRLTMPLWSIDKWCRLGFVKLSLPKHFSRKFREHTTDTASMDLRSKSPQYFRSGLRLVHLIQDCRDVVQPRANRARRRQFTASLQALQEEATELRRFLVGMYTGERLRRTFDWTLGKISDDVSFYTRRLSSMESQLFHLSASAAAAHDEWKHFGSRRIPVSNACTFIRETHALTQTTMVDAKRNVSPDYEKENIPTKRARLVY